MLITGYSKSVRSEAPSTSSYCQRSPVKSPSKLTLESGVEAFALYPDAEEVNICQVQEVPIFFKLSFEAKTDLCFAGIELLSKSAAMTICPKRFQNSKLF